MRVRGDGGRGDQSQNLKGETIKALPDKDSNETREKNEHLEHY